MLVRSWSSSCEPATQRSAWSRRWIRGERGAASCPNGRRCGRSRNPGRCTISPSTDICSRRRRRQPSSRRGSPDRTSWLVAALLHDIGEGSGGDHTEAGIEIAARVSLRMGFPPDDVATVAGLVEHHLLLRDVASRRDVDDPATAHRVATALGSIEQLRLLAALTEADGVATGATAWRSVDRPADRRAHRPGRPSASRMEGGSRSATTFPTPDQLARLMSGARQLDVSTTC